MVFLSLCLRESDEKVLVVVNEMLAFLRGLRKRPIPWNRGGFVPQVCCFSFGLVNLSVIQSRSSFRITPPYHNCASPLLSPITVILFSKRHPGWDLNGIYNCAMYCQMSKCSAQITIKLKRLYRDTSSLKTEPQRETRVQCTAT